MELYQLRYFLEVARQRNFTRAAAQLHLAQAALSEQIRKLEEMLGTSLFHRGRRESHLTAAGETLRLHAEALLERAERAHLAVQELIGLRGGQLTIGAIPSVSACLLPAAISAFRKQYPRVELLLLEGTSETVGQWVEAGRVEFGIVQWPIMGAQFTARTLLEEPFALLLSRRHRLASLRGVSLARLAEEPFIFYKGRARDSALAACRAAGFEPRIACETSELETIRALVGAGLGLAILPRLATRTSSPHCTAIRILKPVIQREVAIVTHAGHELSPAARTFCDMLTPTP